MNRLFSLVFLQAVVDPTVTWLAFWLMFSFPQYKLIYIPILLRMFTPES